MTLRVLIVEDDEDIRQLLTEILQLYGMEAIAVGCPELVLDLARHEAPNLFVIDVMLPRTSGIELADVLRQSGFERTPMIAISASTIMRELAEHTGTFDGVLGKPFDIDELLRCVEDSVRHAVGQHGGQVVEGQQSMRR